jgi:hypothetical protein
VEHKLNKTCQQSEDCFKIAFVNGKLRVNTMPHTKMSSTGYGAVLKHFKMNVSITVKAKTFRIKVSINMLVMGE